MTRPAFPSYTRPARRDATARKVEAALTALGRAAVVLILAGALLQGARLALGTAALDAVIAQAEQLRGW